MEETIGDGESIPLGLDAVLEDDGGVAILAGSDLGLVQILASVAVGAFVHKM